jgi:hypothetical protein
MVTQPKSSGIGDKVSSEPPPPRHELYREACEDEDGNRYTVIVYRTHPGLCVTDYELEDGTPVRFVDDCLFEIETTGRTLTRCR